jgi:site-specific DNA recombinase
MMNVAVYVPVSLQRQAQTQTIAQQFEQLRAHIETHGGPLAPEAIFRDDGYSRTHLARPGLDRLRDAVAQGAAERVFIPAPDRLARNYVHQVLLLEEFERFGCQVEFLELPMSHDPHDQLLLQIGAAVAEYEQALIAERVRRGRPMKLRAGLLLPRTRAPYGYRLHPN